MQSWDPQFTARSPMFAPLCPVVDALAALDGMPRAAWPTASALNTLASRCGACSGGEQALRFAHLSGQPVPAAADYELRIHDDGVVPLRAANWHDFFNALAWLAFPLAKAAINRVHADSLRNRPTTRSVRRDAMTLFDESGVLVLSSDRAVLARIRAFDWKRVFWDERELLLQTTRFVVFGHALYEKALSPYVGMTGHALLLEVPGALDMQDAGALHRYADRLAAQALRDAVVQPHDLSPLPVLGVPGWWQANGDALFYDNADYFRPGRLRPSRRV
jgi:hypothetical protein